MYTIYFEVTNGILMISCMLPKFFGMITGKGIILIDTIFNISD